MEENKTPIIIISGVSGAGKGTVASCLKSDPRIEPSISYTTRQKRPSETNGREYWFISDSEFNKAVKNGEFLEWEEVHRDKYGTKRKDLEKILNEGKVPLFDIDYKGALNLKKLYSNVVTIFITAPSAEAAIERLKNRGTETDSEIELRVQRYKEEMSNQKYYDYTIVNDDLQKAQEELLRIVSLVV